jgi:alanine racemase
MIFLDHVLAATRGVLTYPGKQQRYDAFSHDTRQLIPGEMFVAVRGEHSDGHDFLLDAVERGAAGILAEAHLITALSEETSATLARSGITLITVPDTRAALQHYARYILDLWHPTVIAVTGSTGKTSTKEAIATVLSSTFATFRSWQNYNDLLGIPLSLGRLEERHEYAVLELSCDHPGEISDLCRITRPHIGVLTNVSPAQLQYFGTVDRLSNELAMLLISLPQDGLAIVNEDDCRELLQRTPITAPIQPFSPSSAQHVHVTWDCVRARLIAPLSSPLPSIAPALPSNNAPTSWDGRNELPPYIDLESHLLGSHHVSTMLAAYIVGRQCGLQQEEIQQALAHVKPMPGRLNPLPGIQGLMLLDDTHNATPASMIAGLETLKALPTGKRIAILGDMLRLGDYEEEAHRQVGRQVATCADYLILRGERAELVAESARKAGMPQEHIIITATHEDAAQVARELISEDQPEAADEKLPKATVLLKGSEEMRMERVTERLMAHPEQALEQLVRQTPGWKQIVVMRPERPTWVEIDLSAIANNTRRIKAIVGPDVRILASLKADAYGHGAVKVARTVLHNGASMIGVATVSEATPLRNAGVNAPILVFGYVPSWQMREAVHLDLTVTIYSMEAAQALSRAALALNRNVKVHVKIDTGMGRLGVRAGQVEEVLALLRAIRALPHIEIEGIFTHFAMADTSDQAHVRMQLARFQPILQALDEQGLRPPFVHAANSAALLSLPEARFDMVRPGIALYGLDPSTDVPLPTGFRPALSFKTQVAHVKMVPAGECISYGCQYITERPTRVATLPVGYADGFRRAPFNWGTVLLHGQEAPILGRVCMDQCMIDVTSIPQTRVGDEVILIGRQGSATMSAEQVAQRLGTSNYEVVSAILARVPRVD